MYTFTIILNFLVIGFVFLITCPNEGKGYVTVDWSDLDDSSHNRFNQLWGKVNRGKRTDDDDENDLNSKYNGTYEENSPEIIITETEGDVNKKMDPNELKVKSFSKDPVTLSVIGCYDRRLYLLSLAKISPLTAKHTMPERHERSVNLKRPINDPSRFIILPSRA